MELALCPHSWYSPAVSGRRLFILNPAAGNGHALARWRTWGPALEAGDELVLTTSPGDASRIARQAADQYAVLVAVGGDGTVSEVAEGIRSAPVVKGPKLGVVPLGTGNDFATVIGINGPASATAALQRNQVRSVDVLEVHCYSEGKDICRRALLFAGTGLVTEALKLTTSTVRRLFGSRLAYPVGILRALRAGSSKRMQVTCGPQVFEGEFLFVAASNAELAGGGMRIAPGARVDDGLLHINLIEAVGRLEALRQLRRLCQGRHTAHRNIRYFSGAALEVRAASPIEVAADGELIGYTPLRVQVRPGALEILAGAALELRHGAPLPAA